MEINEMASEICKYILSKSDKQGKEFTDEALDTLTLCISEIIKASYCKEHYFDAYKRVDKQIAEDLNV